MLTLRRMFAGAALAVLTVGIASADNIISYTTTINFSPAELTNVQALLTGWCPGCTMSAQDSVGSQAEPSGYGVTATATGVTMASLNAPNTIYKLQGYDIRVTSFISGNYTVTNSSNSNQAVGGNAQLDSYTAVGLGSQSDVFSNGQNYGPDPMTGAQPISLPLLGNATTVSFANVSQNADLGCTFLSNSPNPPSQCGSYFLVPNSIQNVKVKTGTASMDNANDYLAFNFSTTTQVDTGGLTGSFTTSDQTQVKERITVTYDYTTTVTPAVPEPMTMILMGGALVGLGLVGKHLKKS